MTPLAIDCKQFLENPPLNENAYGIASQLIERLTDRVQELEAWQSRERTATAKMAITLLNAGYKGDGVVGGVQWLAEQLKATGRPAMMAAAATACDHVFAVAQKNAVGMPIVASAFPPDQLRHAQKYCRERNNENRANERPEWWTVMKVPLLNNRHWTEWETVHDNAEPNEQDEIIPLVLADAARVAATEQELAREYLRRSAAGELLQIRLNDWQEEEPDRSTIAGQKAKTFASLETPFGDMVAVEWADGTCGWFPDFTDDDEEDYTPADTLAEAKGAATLWYVARLMENLEPAAPPTATPK